ncbi:MAG: peroxide stress protein YaaA [Magnetovibrio sp.]|nr:peroxide stress protein YaaA [Magnetovibrio sp.]
MLALISPAKKLDFESGTTLSDHSQPELLGQSEILVKSARRLSRAQLARTMKLSDSLADLNYQRYRDFTTPFDLGNAKQAALVFNGDTYVGLQAASLSKKDLAYAQDHLRILSGLYGVLRPLDLIQPYRLEMGARFKPPRKTDLYDFWGTRITSALNQALDGQKDPTVVNCASNEYFKAVRPKELAGPVITPVFKEIKDGQSRVIGMFAKQARGAMARHMITNRVETPDGLKDFSWGGYEYRDDLSDGKSWVFTRDQPPPVGKK